ncbi:MAG: hypothetical protein H6723_11590 [Sandaracinus sp.]|nr:hypothetical protein [Sandaracinus sp.]
MPIARSDARDPSVPEPPSQARQAAQQFESLLIRQLWQVMRQSAGGGLLSGEGQGAGLYGHLIDEAMSSHLQNAGGLGLVSVLERSLSGLPPTAPSTSASRAFGPREAEPVRQRPLEPPTGARVSGATGRLQAAASEMLTAESSPRWGRDGRLTEVELASDFAVPRGDGVAAFNVHDAGGYAGRYKCNLFAFELVRRAGFQTPLLARTHGWGYPHPDAVADDAADGRLRASWGRVATTDPDDEVRAAIDAGERAYLLSGHGTEGHAGHMAVVERVHEVARDPEGNIVRVVFDGWEARVDGARHLVRRTWNRVGNPGGDDPRNGLQAIELVELLSPTGEGPVERPLSPLAGPSRLDARARAAREYFGSGDVDFSSRSSGRDPMEPGGG